MKELVEKLSAVMKELGAVEKTGVNSAQGYKYMAHAQLMQELHPLLVKNGLMMFSKSSKVHTVASTEVNAKRQNRVVVENVYCITDGISTIDFCGIGEGVDSQDKSSYKAQTGAHKYALKALFCIPDELDAELATDSEHAEMMRPENNASKVGGSTQKAGKLRANSLREYADANIISEDTCNAILKKYNVKSFDDLSKDVADELIKKCEAKELQIINKAKAMQNDTGGITA